MAKARLMDTTTDYQQLGVNPNQIELWEDGRRNSSARDHWEWWYFDAILDDGTTVVIQDFTKGIEAIKKNSDQPLASIKVTLSDGQSFEDHFNYDEKNSSFSKKQCDVVIGPHTFKGDFKDYEIHIEPENGLGADLKLHCQAKPYRPGTAYWAFGDKEENFYTWLCAAPKGEVSGTITINGETKNVHGSGYHDHQWGSNVYMTLWNNWVWARQAFDDYSMLVFDMVASKKYNYQRFPVIFIQDQTANLFLKTQKMLT
jgi:predicted secreted hydrolase